MKKILVVYFSQTGQLENIVHTMLEPLLHDSSCSVEIARIKPVTPYPFPWNKQAFFGLFPECVSEIGVAIEPLNYSQSHFDLIILAYQPWFLSICSPMISFLETNEAKQLLAGKKVMTLIGCRNTWTQAQESMKKHLQSMKAELIANVVLFDRAPYLVGVYTVIKWLFYGNKGKSGISQADIDHSKVYGEYILSALKNDEPIEQKSLVAKGAVEVINHLSLMEKRAIILFRLFAGFIRKKGEAGDPKRQGRLRLFEFYLFAGIFILSPLFSLVGAVRTKLAPKRVKQENNYFEGVTLKE